MASGKINIITQCASSDIHLRNNDAFSYIIQKSASFGNTLFEKLEFIQESDLKKTDTIICPARIKAFEVRCVLTR